MVAVPPSRLQYTSMGLSSSICPLRSPSRMCRLYRREGTPGAHQSRRRTHNVIMSHGKVDISARGPIDGFPIWVIC